MGIHKIDATSRKQISTRGVQVLMYFDGWLIIGQSEEDCQRMLNHTLQVGALMGN